MNEYLKELGQLAGFIDLVEIIYMKGGKWERQILKKWELITVHAAPGQLCYQCLSNECTDDLDYENNRSPDRKEFFAVYKNLPKRQRQ
jgi:hypothetical protein